MLESTIWMINFTVRRMNWNELCFLEQIDNFIFFNATF